MNRNKIVFQYYIGDVLDAVKNKIKFHKGRANFYSLKFDQYKKDLQDHGVVIQDHIGASVSNTPTYGGGPDISFDTEIYRKLTQAVERLTHHKNLIKDYNRWKIVLDAQNKGSAVELDLDDIEFFGLVDDLSVEEDKPEL